VPNRGSIVVLGLDPFREVSALQQRIGVQLQQAQLQKRIKVWEAIWQGDRWSSHVTDVAALALFFASSVALSSKVSAGSDFSRPS
jgi:ABC-2 type transport system ATP-binding protein